jgi:hypothetical protein
MVFGRLETQSKGGATTMNKEDFERLIAEPSGVELLGQRARTLAPSLGANEAEVKIPSLHHVGGSQANRLSSTEVQRNDHRHIEQSFVGGGISRHLSLTQGKSPIDALIAVAERQRAHPTLQGAVLLEDAMNRVTLAGDLDASARAAVEDSLETAAKNAADFHGDMVWCTTFEHADFRGKSLYSQLWDGLIYKKVRGLDAAGLNDAISSLRVGASAYEIGGNAILFEHDRFIGRYANWGASPGGSVDVNYVGNFINDRTSSILLVRRFQHDLKPFTVGSQITPDDIKSLVMSQSGISPRGDPTLTWDMWPEGPTSNGDAHPNEPNKTYVYVKVPITVHVPNWFDYDAEVRYWIYLYVDDAGSLQGFTDYYGAWVEGGIIHNQVMGRLMSKIPGTIADVDTKISTAVNLANLFGPYELMYYLPGTNADTGRTTDDVTLILGKRVTADTSVPIW